MLKTLFSYGVILAALFVNQSAHSQFESNPLSQAVDAPNIDLVNLFGTNQWSLTTETSTKGGDSAVSKSGFVENISRMGADIDDKYRGGRISFDWKISSVSDRTLIFRIEYPTEFRETIASISGTTNWQSVSADLPCDENLSIEWQLVTEEFFFNDDRSWVDNVVITQNPDNKVCDKEPVLAPILQLLE